MVQSNQNSPAFDPTLVLRHLAGVEPLTPFQFEETWLVDDYACMATRSEDDVDEDAESEGEDLDEEESDDDLEDEVDEDDEIADGDDEYEDEDDDEDDVEDGEDDSDDEEDDAAELTAAPELRADGLLGYEDEEEDVEKGRSREQGDAARDRDEQKVDDGEEDA